jgi:O-antigen/teichoic acid export membrane protein
MKFVMQIAGTAVLARLLTPADYGLVGMVTVVVNFAAMFKDAGLSMATVQREEISHEQISTLFWINVLISAGLSLCVLVASPLVAMFYDKPELIAVTAALSFSFILSGLTIQHQALQRRHMRFGTLAAIQITSQLITLVVSIILAVLGLRYWALVGGTLANALGDLLLTFLCCPWIPGRMQRGTGVREMLKFGGNVTGFNFINYFSRNADNILIGRFIGADALGLYAKAYNLFLMPISQISGPIYNVAVPTLCAIRNEPERYRNYYRKIIFIISSLNMPLVGFLLVFADTIIVLMLGRQWQEAVVVFQVLAATGFIQSAVQNGRGLPLMSMGYSRRYFYFGIVQSFVTVLGIAVGLRWGINGVAAGYGIAFFLLIPFTLPWCLKGSPVSSRDWIAAIYTPALATFAMILIMIWIKRLFVPDAHVFDLSPYINLKMILLGGLGGTAAYGLALLALPLGRESLLGVLKKVKGVIRSYKIAIASSNA